MIKIKGNKRVIAVGSFMIGNPNHNAKAYDEIIESYRWLFVNKIYKYQNRCLW